MAEHLFPAKYAAIHAYPRSHEVDRDPMVRVYRSSPDAVTLQIRTAKRYAVVTLPLDQAKAIAEALRLETL